MWLDGRVLDRGSVPELDPELGEGLDAARLAVAQRQLVARLGRLRTGEWRPAPNEFGGEGGIGLLILDGFMLRTIALEHRAAAEVLGTGDLLRPWEDDGEHTVYPFSASWRVTEPITLAVLDRAFTARLGPFPEVTSALVGRAMTRSRRIAGHLVLAQLAAVEHRVLLALWHLSDVWGRVRPDGIVLPLRLTHEMLGLIIGARRPSVTSALNLLDDRGMVCAEPNGGGFLLRGDPPQDLPLLRGAAPGRRRSADPLV